MRPQLPQGLRVLQVLHGETGALDAFVKVLKQVEAQVGDDCLSSPNLAETNSYDTHCHGLANISSPYKTMSGLR